MSIKRAPRPKTNYTVIANTILRDENLSFRARGVLACILSRPDNWKTTSESLSRESKEGRNAILTVLKELENVGYMTRRKYQNEKGYWVWESLVYDVPQKPANSEVSPEFRNPTSDNPTSVDPSSDIQTIKEEELYKNKRKEVVIPRTYGDENHQACNLLADLIESNGSKRPVRTNELTTPSAINASDVVAAYVDQHTETFGEKPPSRSIGRLAKESKILLDEGKQPDLVIEAAKHSAINGHANIASSYTWLLAQESRRINQPQKESAVSRSLRYLNESFNPMEAFENKAKELEQ